jgi:hypothetical protein
LYIFSRIERECKTVQKMVFMYCRKTHGSKTGLCRECDELLSYARERLEKCPFQEGKTTCANCPVHCYRHDMREKIKKVIRFSGLRMIYRHPIMALLHLFDALRKEPFKTGPV